MILERESWVYHILLFLSAYESNVKLMVGELLNIVIFR